ncbi:MAG: hypothetical protein AAGM38_10415 [Pseudomonadota bacterium]
MKPVLITLLLIVVAGCASTAEKASLPPPPDRAEALSSADYATLDEVEKYAAAFGTLCIDNFEDFGAIREQAVALGFRKTEGPFHTGSRDGSLSQETYILSDGTAFISTKKAKGTFYDICQIEFKHPSDLPLVTAIQSQVKARYPNAVTFESGLLGAGADARSEGGGAILFG